MSNPIYHQDPEFYERPGTEVPLIVDTQPLMFRMPDLPWQLRDPMPGQAPPAPEIEEGICGVCGKRRYLMPTGLCSFCSRAQQADETHLARAKQPQPSGPRLCSLREGWER